MDTASSGSDTGGSSQRALLCVIYEPDLDKWLKTQQSLVANAAHPRYPATAHRRATKLLLQDDS